VLIYSPLHSNLPQNLKPCRIHRVATMETLAKLSQWAVFDRTVIWGWCDEAR